MRVYDIIKPANEQELSQELRSKPLANRVIQLTVKEVPDELSLRREDTPVEEEFAFRVDTLHLDRPTAVMGAIAVAEALRTARIDATGDNEDDRENKLKLIVP